jgi:hypothetical protein
VCTYNIISFVIGVGQPSRVEIANFVAATLLSIWYTYLLFAHLIDIRRTKHRKKIEELESELAEIKQQALTLEIEAKITEKLSVLFSALLQPPAKDAGGPGNDKSC